MSRRLAAPKTAGTAARFGHRRNRASARHCSARWCRPLRLLRAQARTRASQSLFAQQICWDEPTPRLPSTKSRRPTAILRHPSEWMVAAYCAALFASDYLAPQAVRPHSFSMQPGYANSDRQNDTPQKCLPVDNGLMNRSLVSCTKWRAQPRRDSQRATRKHHSLQKFVTAPEIVRSARYQFDTRPSRTSQPYTICHLS